MTLSGVTHGHSREQHRRIRGADLQHGAVLRLTTTGTFREPFDLLVEAAGEDRHPGNAGGSQLAIAQFSEECFDVPGEQLRLFGCGEVAASGVDAVLTDRRLVAPSGRRCTTSPTPSGHHPRAVWGCRFAVAGQPERHRNRLVVAEALFLDERAPGVEAQSQRDRGVEHCSTAAT